MTDSQDSNANDSQNAQTINIEIPLSVLEGMFRMMTGRSESGTAGSGCCGTPPDGCCQWPEDEKKRSFTFVLNRKE